MNVLVTPPVKKEDESSLEETFDTVDYASDFKGSLIKKGSKIVQSGP